jgi:hypothetical protein
MEQDQMVKAQVLEGDLAEEEVEEEWEDLAWVQEANVYVLYVELKQTTGLVYHALI